MGFDLLVMTGFAIASLLFTIALTYSSIPFLRNLKAGQSIREEGPKSHFLKTGTPTMGGVVFIFVTSVMSIVTTMILHPFTENVRMSTTVAILFVFIGFGMVGFIDDYMKVRKKQNLGLSSKQKLALQLLITIFFIYFVIFPTYVQMGKFELSILTIFDILLIIIMFLGTTNAVNLTDGLDGLASGTMIFPLIILGIIALFAPKQDYTVTIISFTLAASLFGFLVFNFNPAQIFMGDTGSLALGGAICSLAIFAGLRWMLLLLCFVFVLEALSVIIQVTVFKITKGKRRVFKMSPIHHHFELSGWSEKSVVFLFWTLSAVSSGLTFYLFFILGKPF